MHRLTNDLGAVSLPSSGDGRFVAFTSGSNFDSNDTNGLEDVYRRDTNSAGAFVRCHRRASLTNDLGGRQPSISGDGRFVAFTSGSNFDSNDTNGRDDVYRRGARPLSLPMTTSAVMMMKSADDRLSGELAEPLDRPMARRTLIQGQMRSEFVVIVSIDGKDTTQRGVAEDDDAIEAFPTDRADQPLHMPVLPG